MEVFVKLETSRSFSVRVQASDTIEDVKAMICYIEGIPPDQQLLTYDGNEIDDVCTLSDYNIQKEATIHLVKKFIGE